MSSIFINISILPIDIRIQYPILFDKIALKAIIKCGNFNPNKAMKIAQSKAIKKIKNLSKGILMGIAIFLVFTNITKAADLTGFVSQLSAMDIPVGQILGAKGVSRYDLARLLNAVECKDCIVPNMNYINKYDAGYWSNFLGLPDKDFGDITYLGADWNKQSYYYCVAYVGDNNYMKGYPKTSPDSVGFYCKGLFCGNRSVTKAEFIQVIINLIAKYIYMNFEISWEEASKWQIGLKANDGAYKVLTKDDIDTINTNAASCKTTKCKLNNTEEVKTYLKYCMFNLESCGMSPIGKLKQGSWPVAELNLLNRQNVISLTEAEKQDLDKIIDGTRMLEILLKLYNITDCVGPYGHNQAILSNINQYGLGFQYNPLQYSPRQFDYDCDGILNKNETTNKDKTTDSMCASMYNPTQKDMDKDGIPDVCDDDIDNDGIKNPIGIVDDNGNFNIAALKGRSGTLDSCIFVVNSDQIDDDQNKIGDACEGDTSLSMYIAIDNFKGSAPLTATFEAITKGARKNISRDMGDNTSEKGQKITHIFSKPGIYTIKALAEGKGTNDASARTTIVVGGDTTDQKALQIKAPDRIGGSGNFEITLGASVVGDADKIQRIRDEDNKTESKPDASIKKIFFSGGSYQITVKALKGNQIVGVSNFVVGVNAPGSMLKSNILNPYMGDEKVDFSTITYGFVASDINNVEWDRGDGNKEINNLLSTSHVFAVRGAKVVIQTIYLKDGTKLVNFITLYVVDKSLMASYAMENKMDKMNTNTFDKIGFDTNIKGDLLGDYITFIQSYQEGNSIKSEKIKFPYNDLFTYEKGGIYYPQNTLYINQCLYLEDQSTIAVHGIDQCMQAQTNGTLLKSFKCDMNKDGIPDVCDDDIDGDGFKNLLGIYKYENKDKNGNSICLDGSPNANNITNGALDKNNSNLNNSNNGNTNNADIKYLGKHFQGVCSLDNSPFTANPDQMDIDKNGYGDIGNIGISDLMGNENLSTGSGGNSTSSNGGANQDTDGDGIIDSIDSCPSSKENYNEIDDFDGCPEIGAELSCEGKNLADLLGGSYFPEVKAECISCPCQFADIAADLTNNDQFRAVLLDKQKQTTYGFSPMVVWGDFKY